MRLRNITPSVTIHLSGPHITLLPGEECVIGDEYRMDLDIDLLISRSMISVLGYDSYDASFVAQPELNGIAGKTTDDVINVSLVPGTTCSDALEFLASGRLQHYRRMLTFLDISNKYFYLPTVPTNLLNIYMRIIGAPDQVVGVDFRVMSDGKVDWNTYPIDGVLSAGDRVEVLYT